MSGFSHIRVYRNAKGQWRWARTLGDTVIQVSQSYCPTRKAAYDAAIKSRKSRTPYIHDRSYDDLGHGTFIRHKFTIDAQGSYWG